MSLRQLLWAIACTFGISAGQILFKAAALSIGSLNRPGEIWHLIANVYFCVAVFVYALTTLGWVSLLRMVPLKVAYPMIGLVFVIVPFLGNIFLNEKLEIKTLLGGSIIIMGVYLSVA